MAEFHENWILDEEEPALDSWVDIDSTTFFGTVGSQLRGDSQIIGGIIFNKWISSFQTSACFLDQECPPPPPPCIPWDGEPPFPTGEIYGREHLSLNLKLVRGDTYKFDATIVLDNAPVDLTGGTLRMTAKWSLANADIAAVFQLSSPSNGIVITSAAAGQIQVTIASSLTSPLPAKKVELPYDIQFVDSVGAVYTVLYGTLVVVPDATITAP